MLNSDLSRARVTPSTQTQEYYYGHRKCVTNFHHQSAFFTCLPPIGKDKSPGVAQMPQPSGSESRPKAL